MHFTSKKTALLILGITALVCSRVLFLFLNDPEGPNLLIAVGTAAIIYGVSLTIYGSNVSGHKKLLVAMLIQILLVAGLYFLLK